MREGTHRNDDFAKSSSRRGFIYTLTTKSSSRRGFIHAFTTKSSFASTAHLDFEILCDDGQLQYSDLKALKSNEKSSERLIRLCCLACLLSL